MFEGEDSDFGDFVKFGLEVGVELADDVADHFDVPGGAADEGDAAIVDEADGGGGGDDAESADSF